MRRRVIRIAPSRRTASRTSRPRLEVMEPRQLLATFTVTNTSDSGTGSLRAAIAAANAVVGSDTITFAIPGSGVQVINLATALPKVTGPVTIDGTTQPGFSGTPLIELNGAALSSGEDGLHLAGGNSTVKDLMINAFPGNGINIDTSGADTIQGCYLGTDGTGSTTLGNKGGAGIRLGAYNNLIGGTTPAARNVIANNSGNGIHFDGAFSNAPVQNNVVEGNYIGVDPSGTIPMGNGGNGVDFFGGKFNTIGGTTPGAGNVISNQKFLGIKFFASSSSNNTVQGNVIGTDPTGTLPMPNGFDGINIQAATGNLIGGTAPGAGNVISSNKGPGVSTFDIVTGTVIQGNKIGVDVHGNPMGNLGAGVVFGLSNQTNSNCLLGGMTAGAGNVIAYNGATFGDPGVSVTSGTGIAILSNSIFANVGLGIKLSSSNGLQAYPVLASASSDTVHTFVQGSLTSTPSHTFLIQFFGNQTADKSGFGQGQTYIGSTTVNTDATGNVTFSAKLGAGVPVGQFLSATATDTTIVNALAVNNTSQFAQDATVTQAPEADLAVSVGASPNLVTVGSNATYTVTVTNNGPDPATSVVLTNTPPTGATVVSATPSQGTVSGNVANLGTLASGASATLTIVVTPTQAGTMTDSATVTAFEGDPVTGNNTSSASFTAQVLADLGVTLSASPKPVDRGSNLTYTATVTNSGPNPGTGVILTDALPAGLTIVSITPSQGTTSLSGTTLTANLGTIASGASATLTLVVAPGTPGTLSNSVSVAGNETDPNTANNSAGDTTTVNDIPGALGFSAAAYTVSENGGSIIVTVNRANGSLGTVSVNYATADGSAAAGVQYQAASGTLTFGPTDTSKQFTINVLDDKLFSADRTVNLTLTSPTGGATLGTSAAVLTIKETDRPTGVGDFDGDGKADLAVYRKATAQWLILRSTLGGQLFQFGDPSQDIPVPGDYDGDGKTDFAVYRPSTATWFIFQSTAGVKVVQFGAPGLDIPIPADYDGDGKTDIAVYRPTTAQWLILQSTGGPRIAQFGGPGLDVPIPADYDGDGKTDLAVYRASTAQWLILQSTAGPKVFQLGAPNLDIPIPADYDGDGKADVALFRPTTDQWIILQSTAGPKLVQLGAPGLDMPVPNDYDGDGKADLAVYRNTTSQWIILQSSAGGKLVTFGGVGLDVPLVTPLAYRYTPAPIGITSTSRSPIQAQSLDTNPALSYVTIPQPDSSAPAPLSSPSTRGRQAAHDLALTLVQQERTDAQRPD